MTSTDFCQVRCVDVSKVDRIRERMPRTVDLVVLFKALADATRLQVVYALLQEELCVCETAALLETTVQTASHHLRWLKRAGLATHRKEGKLVYYRLVPGAAALLRAVHPWEGGMPLDRPAARG